MKMSQAKKLKYLERENTHLKKLVAEQALDKCDSRGSPEGKILSLELRRQVVRHVQPEQTVSEAECHLGKRL